MWVYFFIYYGSLDEKSSPFQIAVGEAYSDLASFFVSEAEKYLDNHSFMGSKEADRSAWVWACYKLTYDLTLGFDWVEDDQNSGLDSDLEEVFYQDSEEVEREFEGQEARVPPAFQRTYSFPWIFKEDIFLLTKANT